MSSRRGSSSLATGSTSSMANARAESTSRARSGVSYGPAEGYVVWTGSSEWRCQAVMREACQPPALTDVQCRLGVDELVGDGVEDPSDGVEVVLGRQVDEHPPDARHMGRCRFLERPPAAVGEHCLDAATVRDAGVAHDESRLLHAID